MADAGAINPVFEQKLNAMVAASHGRLSIGNSYRSTARQQTLFDAAVKKYGSVAAARHWVAMPGHSKHEEGVAADLKGDLAWAHAHAAEFGLTFPLSHEKWHIELAGARSGKTNPNSSTTAPADYADAPGNPDALDALTATEKKVDYNDPRNLAAKFYAVLAAPEDKVLEQF